jgi:hypothetical protein
MRRVGFDIAVDVEFAALVGMVENQTKKKRKVRTAYLAHVCLSSLFPWCAMRPGSSWTLHACRRTWRMVVAMEVVAASSLRAMLKNNSVRKE